MHDDKNKQQKKTKNMKILTKNVNVNGRNAASNLVSVTESYPKRVHQGVT